MNDIQLSICIVSYRAMGLLRDCLLSIAENPPQGNYECIVVDNNSEDGTQEMLATEFPWVTLIVNSENLGFTVPMNQALKVTKGKYLLQLNPDTLMHPHALSRLVDFMEKHPEAGICSPKVLNNDGTMQKPCRRGESRPLAVIGYFTGLGRLFPKNRRLNEYLMSYMDEDETHAVAGVAGSCMLVRREVIDQIGFLDERFFAYQEDADYCFRARQAGWKVYYFPEAQITHYGGMGGSRVHPYRSTYEWHRSYFLYYRKNLAKDYCFLFNGLYYLVMLIKLAIALLVNFFRKEKTAGRQKPRNPVNGYS
ncbi:MAG: glycosyltransferase family 2 protein [Anaerolineales bacterium]|nr:glycosyltransferase family 2 protein [Anaerolineales bacterium]